MSSAATWARSIPAPAYLGAGSDGDQRGGHAPRPAPGDPRRAPGGRAAADRQRRHRGRGAACPAGAGDDPRDRGAKTASACSVAVIHADIDAAWLKGMVASPARARHRRRHPAADGGGGRRLRPYRRPDGNRGLPARPGAGARHHPRGPRLRHRDLRRRAAAAGLSGGAGDAHGEDHRMHLALLRPRRARRDAGHAAWRRLRAGEHEPGARGDAGLGRGAQPLRAGRPAGGAGARRHAARRHGEVRGARCAPRPRLRRDLGARRGSRPSSWRARPGAASARSAWPPRPIPP